MSEFDGFEEPGLEEGEESTIPPVGDHATSPSSSLQELAQAELEQGRKDAIERGRLLGEEEAVRRRETGHTRDQRIKRAMMYAAWDYDGRPQGYGDRYAKEFGVDQPPVTPSLERA